jgi:uncharacterized protein YneR
MNFLLLLALCNPESIKTVVITERINDIFYKQDTVQATFWIKQDDHYYVKGLNGIDYKSDTVPVQILKGESNG